MRSARIDVFWCILAALLLPSANSHAGRNRTTCQLRDFDVDQCRKNERCYQRYSNDTPSCECKQGFEMVNNECVRSISTDPVEMTTAKMELYPSSGGGSVAAGLLIPIFLVITGVLLYLGARRYKWLQRFRQYRQNRYGNVLVTRDDDDDDDPPIA